MAGMCSGPWRLCIDCDAWSSQEKQRPDGSGWEEALATSPQPAAAAAVILVVRTARTRAPAGECLKGKPHYGKILLDSSSRGSLVACAWLFEHSLFYSCPIMRAPHPPCQLNESVIVMYFYARLLAVARLLFFFSLCNDQCCIVVRHGCPTFAFDGGPRMCIVRSALQGSKRKLSIWVYRAFSRACLYHW